MAKVIDIAFRKCKDTGEIIAVISPVLYNGRVMTYAHIGQHSEADYMWYRNKTVPATKSEYKDLYNELDFIYCHIGDDDNYDSIRVVKKIKREK